MHGEVSEWDGVAGREISFPSADIKERGGMTNTSRAERPTAVASEVSEVSEGREEWWTSTVLEGRRGRETRRMDEGQGEGDVEGDCACEVSRLALERRSREGGWSCHAAGLLLPLLLLPLLLLG